MNTANMKVGALATIVADSTDVGGTTEPYQFSVEATTQEFFVEQSQFPVISKTISRTAKSTTALAEPTVDNLAIAYGLPTGNVATSALQIDSGERGNFTFVATTGAASAPGTAKHRVFNFPETTVGGTPSLNYAKEEMSVLSLEFTHLANGAGVVGMISDVSD